MRTAAAPVIALLQFRHERTTSKEDPEMSDVRAEVERAYQTAAEVVQRHDLQHLNPYQLAGHIGRARQAHLADLDDPTNAAGLTPVDPDEMAAAEDHPEDAARDWYTEGKRAAELGQPRTAPSGKHARSKEVREWFRGYDEVKG